MHLITHAAHFGSILKGRRKVLKLSQTQVASRLGLSQNRLSELESRPHTLTVEQLLALLNMMGLEMFVRDRPASGKTRIE